MGAGGPYSRMRSGKKEFIKRDFDRISIILMLEFIYVTRHGVSLQIVPRLFPEFVHLSLTFSSVPGKLEFCTHERPGQGP